MESDVAEDQALATHLGLGPFGAALPQVCPWDSGRFRFVRKIEDAERNHGWVDAFVDLKQGSGVQCAVKRMPREWATTSPTSFAKTQPLSVEVPWTDIAIVQHLNSLECGFAYQLLGLFADHDFLYVVSSLASDGDLCAWSSACPLRGQARECALQPFMVQLFSAVQHLHDLGIAHRDICLGNVLLHQDARLARSWSARSAKSITSLASRGDFSPPRPYRTCVEQPLKVKLIDYGMATVCRNCRAGEVRGKPQFQSPEMHDVSRGYDSFAADVFALGVLLFAVVSEAYPWTSTEAGECPKFGAATKKGIPVWFEAVPMPQRKSVKLATIISEGCQELITGMLELNPELRSNLGEECWSQSYASERSVWRNVWLNAQPVGRRMQVTGSTRSMVSVRSLPSASDSPLSQGTIGDADSWPSVSPLEPEALASI